MKVENNNTWRDVGYLPKAYISIEDEKIWATSWCRYKRTGAAVLSFVTHGGKSTAGGGSTITQQVVKNITHEKAKWCSRCLRKVKRNGQKHIK